MLLPSFLFAVGAFARKHSGRTLGQHLIGTALLLHRAGCPEHVVVAGALHSIYGTNAFKAQTLDQKDRPQIAQVFGARAERLAWLFGTINRPRGLEDGKPVDWRTKRPVEISDDELMELRLIEAANLIEQGASIDRFPLIRAAWKKEAA